MSGKRKERLKAHDRERARDEELRVEAKRPAPPNDRQDRQESQDMPGKKGRQDRQDRQGRKDRLDSMISLDYLGFLLDVLSFLRFPRISRIPFDSPGFSNLLRFPRISQDFLGSLEIPLGCLGFPGSPWYVLEFLTEFLDFLYRNT